MINELYDLIVSLRIEATDQELQARRVNAQGIPVYNPVCLGRMLAKQDAAERLERILSKYVKN
jgi:hypothetical protein